MILLFLASEIVIGDWLHGLSDHCVSTDVELIEKH